jgi:hypothetical protein
VTTIEVVEALHARKRAWSSWRPVSSSELAGLAVAGGLLDDDVHAV